MSCTILNSSQCHNIEHQDLVMRTVGKGKLQCSVCSQNKLYLDSTVSPSLWRTIRYSLWWVLGKNQNQSFVFINGNHTRVTMARFRYLFQCAFDKLAFPYLLMYEYQIWKFSMYVFNDRNKQKNNWYLSTSTQLKGWQVWQIM